MPPPAALDWLDLDWLPVGSVIVAGDGTTWHKVAPSGSPGYGYTSEHWAPLGPGARALSSSVVLPARLLVTGTRSWEDRRA